MTTVTVIIPTYNRVNMVERAIDSVFDQTIEDLELIVVDDASTDGTIAMLEDIDDERLRVIEHETNQGANKARNTGIAEAEGEYIAFLDSDDEWRPRKLELQLDRLRDPSSDYVAVYCDSERSQTGIRGRAIGAVASLLALADDPGPREGGEELVPEILAGNLNTGAGSTLVVETSVVQRVGGFDEDLERFQDPEFLLRIVQEGKLAYVDESLVIRHATATPEAESIRRSDEKYLTKHESAVRDAEAKGYRVRPTHELLLAMYFFEEGKFASGSMHLLKADVPVRHWPGLVWTMLTGFRSRISTPAAVVAGLLTVLLLYGLVASLTSPE